MNQRSMELSEEATKPGIELAKQQGAAFQKTLQYMVKEVAHGEIKPVGELLVGYAVEEAEGLYYPVHDHLEWQEPTEQNAHVEVVICDSRDGRFIPGLTVLVTLIDATGTILGTHLQPFLWHPWLYHYGLDWKVPREGKYSIKIQVAAPEFARHDKANGRFFEREVEVTFENVSIKVGQKK